jgi:hypothetical protein
MRFAPSACLMVLLACSATADLRPCPEVTVILDFKGPHSSGATIEMQTEAASILREANVSLSWRPLAAAYNHTYRELVVMSFKGSCELAPNAPIYDEPGPYAYTRIADGKVLPFGEVDCTRVVSSVRRAMISERFAWPDYVLGRALGRVVAHELVHMLTRSVHHGSHGVTQASLSGRQLIGGPLRLEKDDILKLQERLSGPWPTEDPLKTVERQRVEAENLPERAMFASGLY